jgi:ribosomal protein S18 acetylase RimI-like enzyme
MKNNFNKSSVEIIKATPEDIVGIQEVFYKTWLDTYPNEEVGITIDDIEDRYKDTFTQEVLNKRAEQIANPPEGHTLLIAKEDKKVIGLCRIIKSKEQNRLQAIYVLPEYQGKGIGKQLWNEALNFFEKKNAIVVAVASYNKNAINFYKKLGFEDSGKRREDEKFRMKSGALIPEMEMIKKQ